MKISHDLYFSVFIAVFLSACGAHERSETSSSRTFVTVAENSPDENYDIEVPDRTSPIVERPDDVVSSATSASEFAQKIHSLKLDSNPDTDSPMRFVMNLRGDSNTYAFYMHGNTATLTEEKGKYRLRYQCGQDDCERAWMMVTEIATGQVAEIQYEKTIKFFNHESAIALKLNEANKNLVMEAVRFGFPVEHHHLDIINGSSIDTLIIIRPNVDDSSNANNEKKNPEEPKKEQKPPELVSQDVIEITTSDTKPVKPETKKPEPSLVLSSDPKDAYPIKLPEKLFKSGTVIRDNILMPQGFEVVPAEKQESTEPAYRIYVVAKAFVDQRIQIYQNACNIFVRSVMNVAGYTKINGGIMANDFHTVFQKSAHNLNSWERENFKFESSKHAKPQQAAVVSTVKTFLPEHAVIFQSIRKDKSHGHLGIIANVNNRIIFFDSSKGSRRPSYRAIDGSQLLNNGRRNINIFSIPEIRTSAKK